MPRLKNGVISRSRVSIPISISNVCRHRFPAIVVAAVVNPIINFKMISQLGIQNSFGKRLLQVVKQPVRIEDRLHA